MIKHTHTHTNMHVLLSTKNTYVMHPCACMHTHAQPSWLISRNMSICIYVYIPPYTEVSLDKCSMGGDRLCLFLGLCIAYVS